MGKAKDKAILGKAYITWFRLQIAIIGKKRTHMAEISRKQWWKTDFIDLFF